MLWASSHAFAFLMVSHWLIPYMVNKTGLLIYFWIALNITPLSLWAAAQGEGSTSQTLPKRPARLRTCALSLTLPPRRGRGLFGASPLLPSKLSLPSPCGRAAQGEGPGERLNFSGPSETPSCQGACALSVLYLSLIKLRILSAASMHSSRGATRARQQCPLPG